MFYFLLDTSYEICINPKWLPICTTLIMFAGGFTYNFHIDVYFRSTSLERTQLLFVQLVLFIEAVQLSLEIRSVISDVQRASMCIICIVTLTR